MWYILKDKKPVKASIEEWDEWSKENQRHIDEAVKDGIRVSTIFLGLDHSFGGGEPVLFETMIFGGEHDQDLWRYKTWEEAVDGHATARVIAGV